MTWDHPTLSEEEFQQGGGMSRTNYPRSLTRQDYVWLSAIVVIIALIVVVVWLAI